MNLALSRDLILYKKNIRLTPRQRNLLIGTILGDGNLRFVRKNREASFIVDHSITQKDYVFWKYEIMREFVLTEPKELVRIYHKDKSRLLRSSRFSTISHSEFTSLYELFYRNKIKIIPVNIGEILKSPLSLAIWFMDDGNKNHQSVFLNTQQFTLGEQEILRSCLRDNFGLESTINKHWLYKEKQLYRIRLNTVSTKKLYDLIYDLVLPSMRYKFPSFPVTTLSVVNSDRIAISESL